VDALSLRELEAEAHGRLERPIYDFFAGGAEDEMTLRANEAAFSEIGLVPRVLSGSGPANLQVTVLGHQATMPVFMAPTAFHCLAHPEGERATARAAAEAGTIMIVSMASTVAIEDVVEVARTADSIWFQLYIQPDLDFTEAVVRRAEAAGCKTLVISADSAAFGRRERDLRNSFNDLPRGLCCENMRDMRNGGAVRKFVFSREISWTHIDWLRAATALKIVLKGIVHPADARLAVERGVDAIIVSNHGGRQLDTVPAAIELLPGVADAVSGRVPLLMDGGIRRGTDVLKALALGATAVAIGRPVIWGLAVGGQQGVLQVLEMLRCELNRALALCGCVSLRDIGRDLLYMGRQEARC
jgi:4-hydroxymandelate oxidase